jgi:RNA polymerase sigma-70 factor, ECF subfamily
MTAGALPGHRAALPLEANVRGARYVQPVDRRMASRAWWEVPARADSGTKQLREGLGAVGGEMDTVRDQRTGSKESEGDLLRHAVAGDRAALEALFTQNHRSLYQTALRLLGNADDAEDALQDGMLAAYRNLQRFQGRSRFSTWLTRIVINAALMQRRSQRAHPALSLDEGAGDRHVSLAEWFADGGPSPEELCADSEFSERLQRNLEDLSPLLRHAFELRELEGFSPDEAAKALGVSRNTLKARLWRARQQLAARLRCGPTQSSGAASAAAAGLLPTASSAGAD